MTTELTQPFPSPLLVPFTRHKTTIYAPTSPSPIKATIDPLSSRSLIHPSLLTTHFASLPLHNTHPPLPSLLDGKWIKTTKYVNLEFAFRDIQRGRVECKSRVMVCERKELEGWVLLGCEFLAESGWKVEDMVLVLGERRVRVERVA